MYRLNRGVSYIATPSPCRNPPLLFLRIFYRQDNVIYYPNFLVTLGPNNNYPGALNCVGQGKWSLIFYGNECIRTL